LGKRNRSGPRGERGGVKKGREREAVLKRAAHIRAERERDL